MEVKLIYIEQLLEVLADQTQQARENKGFSEMSAMMESKNYNISRKYLYENLHLSTIKAKGDNNAMFSLQASKLDAIAHYLNFPSFRAFCEQHDLKRNESLLSCIGTFNCYVRRNDNHDVIMQSPVQIVEEGNKVWFVLRAPTWTYRGEVRFKSGCLFVLMHASGGKEIHHVYKIGERERPPVLQGVFSGVSTVFEPIAGRTILIRTEERFDALKNKALEIATMKKSKNKEQRRLAEYFSTYGANNIRINNVTTFTIDDLGKCK